MTKICDFEGLFGENSFFRWLIAGIIAGWDVIKHVSLGGGEWGSHFIKDDGFLFFLVAHENPRRFMVFKNNAHFLGGIFDAISKNGCAPNGKAVFKGKNIDNGAVGV